MDDSIQNEQTLNDDIDTETIQPPKKFKITGMTVAGFMGWFLVNGLAYAPWGEYYDEFIGLFLFPLNLVLLVILAVIKKTRQVAWGILIAVGINLILSLILGLFLNALCMIPFFYNIYY